MLRDEYKFKKIFVKCLASGVMTLAGASSWGAVPTLKIGVILPMSGGTASFGQQTMSGAKMAIDEINKAGAIKVEYVLEDDKSETSDAANAAKKLINVDKVNVLMGSVASSNTNAAAPIAQAAKIPLMTPLSTNPNVTKKGEYISRICFIDDFQGYAMAKFAVDSLKAKTAALIIDSASDYSKGLAEAFRSAFRSMGGQIKVEVSYVQKDQDFSSQLTKVRMTKPDVVFVPGYYSEVGIMIKQAKTLGIRAPFLGGDGWSSPDLFKLAGDAIVGNYFSDHFSEEDKDPKVQDFVKRYQSLNKKLPDGMVALGYDAIYFLVDAFRRSGFKTSSVDLMHAINSTKNYKAVSGDISLDKDRNARKPLVILQTQKDRAVFKQRVMP